MSLRTLKNLLLDIYHMSSKKITIQEFNQHSQKALSSIILPVQFGQLYTEVKFYVINVDTSYRALLGWSWLHKNYVVHSIIHRCMKYNMDEREFVIKGDIQPFDIHKIRYEDACYFLQPVSGVRIKKRKNKKDNAIKKYNKRPFKMHLWSESESFIPSSSDTKEENTSEGANKGREIASSSTKQESYSWPVSPRNDDPDADEGPRSYHYLQSGCEKEAG